MILAVEIGGTKLQLAVFDPRATQLLETVRVEIDSAEGASGILRHIAEAVTALMREHQFRACGVGFGGPVRGDGTIYKSHQIAGWDDFDLRGWFQETTGLTAQIANDCDAAAMAEAHFGAGRGVDTMFYVTVGTGVGGGMVVAGQRFGRDRPAVGEIGHLRPGLNCQSAEDTVESFASGWGIVRQVHRLAEEMTSWLDQGRLSFDSFSEISHLEGPVPEHEQLQMSLDWYRQSSPTTLTAEQVAEAAAAGLWLPRTAIELATTVLGWAIAQTVTMTAVERVVVGGGVSKMGAELFWKPLRQAFAQYAFAPLRGATEIVPASLGDEVVLFGAAAITHDHHSETP